MRAPVFVDDTAPAVDDLSDLLAELGERAARFAIVDESSAGWVVDKLLSLDEKEARVKAQAAALLADVKRDRERLEKRFLLELEAWYDAQPKKGKTLKLMTGTLAKRTVPGGVTIADATEAMGWAATNLPAAIKPVPTLDKDAIKAHFLETGEAIPGVELRPERESFSVKATKEAT